MVTKVLMVCLGNICRSPLAEGLLQQKVDPEKIQVASAGTAGYHVGNPPDERSIAVAAKYGLDISQQRSRKLIAKDLERFDYIYAMDRSNYRDILALAETNVQAAKVRLLLETAATSESDVPDPYYGGEDGFEKVYSMVNEACARIAEQLQSN